MTPAERKSAVIAAALREASPTRTAVERRRALAWLGAGAWVLLLFGGLGGMRAVERPVAFVLATAAGWAAVALIATWGAGRGGSMLGRPREALVALVVVVPVGLEAWYAGWLGGSGYTAVVSPLDASVRCALATVALALAPLLVSLRGRKGGDPIHPRVTGAAVGAVCGAWAAVLLDLHCERADLAHVTLGHVAPVALLAALGAAVGGSWLSVRSERSPSG